MIKNYAYHRLTKLLCEVIEADDSNIGAVNPKYGVQGIPGSLDDCSWSGFELSENADLDKVSSITWPMVRINTPEGQTIRSRFIYDVLNEVGSYVISVDENEIAYGRYRCPVCGRDDKGFTITPPTEFDMDSYGEVGAPKGLAADGDAPCTCKSCGFEGNMDAFNTGKWKEYTSSAE